MRTPLRRSRRLQGETFEWNKDWSKNAKKLIATPKRFHQNGKYTKSKSSSKTSSKTISYEDLLQHGEGFRYRTVFVASVFVFVALCCAIISGGDHFTHEDKLHLVPWTLVFFSSAVFSLSPLAQAEEYHDFADQRRFLIPNFMDVVSNAPFLIFGLIGLEKLYPHMWVDVLGRDGFLLPHADLGIKNWGTPTINSDAERRAWTAFYISMVSVSFGSAYYHWYRTPGTLVWDRLPISVAFLAALNVLQIERLDADAGQYLYPMLLVGILSVFIWHFTNDLRTYIIVQGYPTVIMPCLMAKCIEAGAHGGKGSEAHMASRTGHTVGDPFKDSAGVAQHVIITRMTTTYLVVGPVFIGQPGGTAIFGARTGELPKLA
eukprot:g4304.t1